MYEPREKVFWFSIISRALVIFLQLIFNASCIDHKADAFRTPRNMNEKITIYDQTVDYVTSGLTRWDGQYFIHIAKYGYTYESTLAFFPMYPMFVRFLAIILKKVLFMLNEDSTITISAVTINYFCFVKSAVIFYDLSVRIHGRTGLAYKSAILYCINPASIFFTAAYSESMFAYLTFYSMLGSLENDKFVYLPIGLSCLVRSNGLLNIGFPIFVWMKNWFILVLPNIMKEFHEHSTKRASIQCLISTIYVSFNIINTVFLSIVPFVFLQIYIYLTFCTDYYREISIEPHVAQYAVENNLIMPGGNDSLNWCREDFPLAYTKIQAKYWNVGFMNYYEFKQIPNFILAFPVLYIMTRCIFHYFSEHKETWNYYRDKKNERNVKTEKTRFPIEMFVFIVHGLFLTLFSILFVHIQVSTRLLASASPLIYWYCASVMSDRSNNSNSIESMKEYEKRDNINSKWKVFFINQKSYTFDEKCVLLYFLGYFVLGCFMYSNFLPWT